MATEEFSFALLVQCGLAWIGVTQIAGAFHRPGWYLEKASLSRLNIKREWLIVPVSTLWCIPIGTVVYSATYSLINAIPYDWGWHDEDEIWHSLRSLLRWSLTIIGTIWLMMRLDKIAAASLTGVDRREPDQ